MDTFVITYILSFILTALLVDDEFDDNQFSLYILLCLIPVINTLYVIKKIFIIIKRYENKK